MSCFLTNQKNEPLLNIGGLKICNLKVENGKLIINKCIYLPIENILEIKVHDKEVI